MKNVLWVCVVANILYATTKFTLIITPAYIIILFLLIILCSSDKPRLTKLLSIVTAICGILLAIFQIGNLMMIITGVAIILEIINEYFVGINNAKYDKSLGIDGLEEQKIEVIKIATDYDIDRIRDTFDDFVAEYNKTNHISEIQYKHIINVANNALNIARSIELDEEGRYLAYAIGIFHDLGRYKATKEDDTSDDTNIVDHADYGCDLLENGLIRQFIHDNKYDEIIFKVIRNHNKFSIDSNFSEDVKLYCSIIRDADKLDIFKSLSEGNFEDDYSVTKDMLISSEITREISAKHSIEFRLVNNNLDKVILRLAMVYDINFGYTLKSIKQNDYLNKYIVLLDTLDSNKIILGKIVNEIYEDIDKKLK